MASRYLSFRHPSWVWAEKTGNCPWPPKKVCHFVVQILFWVWEISVLLLIQIGIRNLHRYKILCLNLMLITSGVSLCCPQKYASCLKTTTLNVSKPLKMAAIIMNVSKSGGLGDNMSPPRGSGRSPESSAILSDLRVNGDTWGPLKMMSDASKIHAKKRRETSVLWSLLKFFHES